MGRGRGRGRASGGAGARAVAATVVSRDAASASPRRGRGGRPRILLRSSRTPSDSSKEAAAAGGSPSSPVVVVAPPPRRMLTRSLLNGTSPALDEYVSAGVDASAPASPTVVVGGVIRCVCNAFLVSSQETLLACGRCQNWSHPACVGVDHAELRQLQRSKSFVCPYCLAAEADTGASRAHPAGSPLAVVPSSVHLLTASRRPPVPRQVPLKLREVPDRAPASAQLVEQLLSLLSGLKHVAVAQLGFEVIDLPTTKLGDRELEQCLECCAAAVEDATFSENYPVYCLKEVCQPMHPYVQGTVLKCAPGTGPRAGAVCSLVLSSGMDGYGNLKPTITQLKSALHRGLIPGVWVATKAGGDDAGAHAAPAARLTAVSASPAVAADGESVAPHAMVTPFMEQCMGIADVSDFVHVTLSATHTAQQRQGLARLLMAMDLLKWALRGRTRAFLNMAIEKRLVDNGTRVEFASSPASKRLYESFGFCDVFPRFDPQTMKERWTSREADMGRVMANLNFVPHVIRVAEGLLRAYREGTRGKSSGSSGSSGAVEHSRTTHLTRARGTLGAMSATSTDALSSALARHRNATAAGGSGSGPTASGQPRALALSRGRAGAGGDAEENKEKRKRSRSPPSTAREDAAGRGKKHLPLLAKP